MISIIVAYSQTNRVIGNNNKLPWYIPSDMKRFKNLTTNHKIVMGRNTFESLNKTPLKNRDCYIMSNNREYEVPESCTLINDIYPIVLGDIEGEEIFIIGGEQIYRKFLPFSDKLYIAEVIDIEKPIVGDVTFPIYNDKFWKVVNEEECFEEGDSHRTIFKIVERINVRPLRVYNPSIDMDKILMGQGT